MDSSLCNDAGTDECVALLEALDGFELLVFSLDVVDPFILMVEVPAIQLSDLGAGFAQCPHHLAIVGLVVGDAECSFAIDLAVDLVDHDSLGTEVSPEVSRPYIEAPVEINIQLREFLPQGHPKLISFPVFLDLNVFDSCLARSLHDCSEWLLVAVDPNIWYVNLDPINLVTMVECG